MKIIGKVVHGRGEGNTFGFPTANIETSSPLPKNAGVYCGIIKFNNERYPTVVNIGSCPTFSVENETVEAHIIGFNGNLYGAEVTLIIREKIRDIKKFDTPLQLKDQIEIDKENCLLYLRNSSLCFSGHRQERLPKDPDELRRLKVNLYAIIDDAIADGMRTFYYGGCEGFDMLSALAVIAKKNIAPEISDEIELIAVVPFQNQDCKWNSILRKDYKNLLSKCDHIITLNENYIYGCYHERNRYMVDHSSRLICYYDGGKGGTKYTVDYALKNGLDVVNLF